MKRESFEGVRRLELEKVNKKEKLPKMKCESFEGVRRLELEKVNKNERSDQYAISRR